MDLNRLIETQNLPRIIQGGMGAAVSGWPLARAVSKRRQIGVVSLTGLAIYLSRRLQIGDPGGAIRRAKEAFQKLHIGQPEMSQFVWDQYFIPGGKRPDVPFKSIPMPDHKPGYRAQALLIFSSFVEVWLAKEGHDGIVGANVLTKLEAAHLLSIFGALLAGVDFIVAGAGLPTQLPELLERLSSFEEATYNLHVVNGPSYPMKFDPNSVMSKSVFDALRAQESQAPYCFGIVSTASAARVLLRGDQRIAGFVVEGPTAGGHNASPRKTHDFDEFGQPIYYTEVGGNDNPGIEEIREFRRPYWLAGGYSYPEAISDALAVGAAGTQVGTPFAYCRESGFPRETKLIGIQEILDGTYRVLTDPVASPSFMPIKAVQREGTMAMKEDYDLRVKICDLGYLRHPYWPEDENGKPIVGDKLLWRCPAEPEDDYVAKGGERDHTIGRKCICNGLMAALGLGQIRKWDGSVEKPFFTSGDNVLFMKDLEKYLKLSDDGLYSADQVIDYLLGTST